jgi:signal transduction histidine kinase
MALKETNILIISSQKTLLEDVKQALNPLPCSVFYATTLHELSSIISKEYIHIAVLDMHHERSGPHSAGKLDVTGYTILRNDESTKKIPVILIDTVLGDNELISQYQKAGPISFLLQHMIPALLHAEVMKYESMLRINDEFQQLADESTLLKLDLSRRNKQLSISSQIARQISSNLDLNVMLHEIVHLIQTEFKYYYVSIWLTSEDNSRIELKDGSYDTGRSVVRIEPGFSLSLANDTSIITHVCETYEPYTAQDTDQDPYYLPTDALPNTRAQLTFPLLAKGHLFGVIDIESDRPNAFQSDDVEILSAVADQTAIAIRNASLYNEVLQSREELENSILDRTRELRETNRQLELLEQNKTDFIQVLSHELRTPLTLVSGYAELLLSHELAESDPFFRQPVLGVMTGAQRLHELIDSMVDMLKIDSRSLQLMPQVISIEGTVAPIIETLSDALSSRHLELTVSNLDILPDIEGDLELLGKVFDQLITNAIKYTPDGGQIIISGRHLLQDFGSKKEEFVEISISDTGIGISPEHLDVIFTKFYRTGDVSQHSSGRVKFKGGGPGLGLSIAKGIVEAHHGRIWAESPGYDEVSCPGSCFYVLLPLTQAT